ncbi:hypothetical protein BaRGS_00003886, partial [Batillaria attramentaria]
LCERPWRKVYEHGPTGSRSSGNLQDLQTAITRGDGIRVVVRHVSGPQDQTAFSVEADNAVRFGDHVCAESLSSLNHFNSLYTAHSEGESMWHVLPCTSGNMHVVGVQLGGGGIISDKHFKFTGSWFVRSWAPGGTGCDASDGWCSAGVCHGVGGSCDLEGEARSSSWPVYSHYMRGDSAARKKISVLLDAVQRGQDVRAVMRDRGYSFPVDLVRWSVTQSWVNGQSVAHIGQRHFRTHVGMRTQAPYLWLSSWSTTGRRHNSRWALGGHVSRGANEDDVSLDWMTDACWRHVFTNDARGQHVRGSREELVASIRSGHRVRVVIGNTAAEADVLRVRGDHVGAQLLKQLSSLSEGKGDHHLLHDQARWRWQLVHTTGTILRLEVLVGNATVLQEEVISATVSWFVDTRPWQRLLLHSQGTTSGRVTDVASAVLGGASVRLRIRHDATNGDIFAPSANLKVSGLDSGFPVTSAQVLRYLSDEVSGDYEVRFQGRLTWWMTTVDSTGVMSLSAWDLGHNYRHFDIKLAPDIDWFVNH